MGDDVPIQEHSHAILTDKQVGAFVVANKFCWLIWLVLILAGATLCFGSAFAWLLGLWHQEAFALARWIPWWGPPVVGPPVIYSILRCI